MKKENMPDFSIPYGNDEPGVFPFFCVIVRYFCRIIHFMGELYAEKCSNNPCLQNIAAAELK